jgi:hypothetical protein
MPQIRLDVPLVNQEKNFCCWHTAAYMIWLYWQKNGKGAGPMFTVPSTYAVADTEGIYPAEFITLAQNVGLISLPVKNQHAEQDLFDYLKDSGPVWSAGLFGISKSGKECGHVIVSQRWAPSSGSTRNSPRSCQVV